MTTLPKINPEMIVLARDLKGYSQADLAVAISVTQATVARYESAQIEPPVEQLQKISEVFGRPVGFFYWQDELYGASCLYHRKNRRIPAAELRMIYAKVNLLRIQASRLLQKAKVGSRHEFHRLDQSVHGGPEGCARKLRQLWQLPPGPIRHVVKSIESAGGMVFRCGFGVARVDGISQWVMGDKSPPVFFVSDDIPGDRERLTLAHEIGHVVMHHLPNVDDPELEANRFAGEFLMPADEIQSELHNMSLSKAATLKSYWKVSMQAIIVRAHQLRKVDDAEYKRLFHQLSAKGYRKCEPVLVMPEEPRMFKDLLSFHQRTLGIKARDLAELLGEMESFEVLQGGIHPPKLRLIV